MNIIASNTITNIIAANINSGRLNAQDKLIYLRFINTTPKLSKFELATIKRLISKGVQDQ